MSRRIPSLDYLKIVLAAGVVLGHAILIDDRIVGWSFLVGNGVLRSLVPTFSVLSGYCLHVTMARGKAGRWLGGLTLVYLFWTAFYAPIWLKSVSGPWDALWFVLWGPMHLWYVSGLILSGLLLAGFVRLERRRGGGLGPMLVAALVLALAGSAVSFWSFLGHHAITLEWYRNGFTVIFPFSAAGYALAEFVARRGREALPRAGVLWAATVGLFAVKTIEAWFDMRGFGISAQALPDVPLFAYPAAILLFLAFLRLDLRQLPVNLSLWSSSIYFLHIFIILLLRHLGLTGVGPYWLAGVALPILGAIGLERGLRLLPRGRRASAPPAVVAPMGARLGG